MTISKRLRFEVLTRDGHTCRYCGGQPPDVKLTVDHVLPVTLGGTSEPTNLVAACADCNAGKSSVAPGSEFVAQVSEDVIRWNRALAEAAQIKLQREIAIADAIVAFDAGWEVVPQYRNWRDGDWEGSVAMWLSRGLSIDLLFHAIDRSATKVQPWRYLCKVAWGMLSDIEAEAASLVHQ